MSDDAETAFERWWVSDEREAMVEVRVDDRDVSKGDFLAGFAAGRADGYVVMAATLEPEIAALRAENKQLQAELTEVHQSWRQSMERLGRKEEKP